MDTLTLKGLRFEAFHGYFEEERKLGNLFETDLTFHGNFRQAGETDDLSLTIDYQKAEEIVRSVMEGPPVSLIETLCRNTGEKLFAEFENANRIEVVIRKMNPPLQTPAACSEIRMTWNR